MPLYTADLKRDTEHLGPTEFGIYMRLILHHWDYGSLPNDEKMLRRIAKAGPREWKNFVSIRNAFFSPDWQQKRVIRELQRFEATREKRSAAGVIGNTKRWQMRSPGDVRLSESTATERRESVAAKGSSKKTPVLGGGSMAASSELTELMKTKNGQ